VAVGVRPPLYVALLAYSAVQLLGQNPLTPGGLGVVEAGLAATLALAGAPAAPAALATLATAWRPTGCRSGSVWAAWMWHRHRYGPNPPDRHSRPAPDAAAR
jgi:hypothetical protein